MTEPNDLNAAAARSRADGNSDTTLLAGIDGCKPGWLVALEAADGSITLNVIGSPAEILRRWPELTFAVIDIPIGLTERTPRAADIAARKYLGKRGCTVFPAPYRAMLQTAGQSPERGQQEASQIRRSLDGKGCSRQSYMIFDKIRDVDHLMTPSLQSRLIEGHPEVSFAMMQGGIPIQTKKARTAGRLERMAALAPHFGDLSVFVCQRQALGVAADDILDAFALLWTARRLRDCDTVLRLPDSGEEVEGGLIAQIVA